MNIPTTIVLIVGSMIAVSADDNAVSVAIPSTTCASGATSHVTNCHLINDKLQHGSDALLRCEKKGSEQHWIFALNITETAGNTMVKLRVELENGLDKNLNGCNIAEYQLSRVEVKKVKKYHPIDSAIARNWTDAAKYCEDQAWKLASIVSEEENDQVLLALSDAKYDKVRYWISGYESVTGERYKWKYTNEPFSVSKWDRKEPSRTYNSEFGQNERCVEIRTKSFGRRWNDVTCNINLGILCEEITDTIYADCE